MHTQFIIYMLPQRLIRGAGEQGSRVEMGGSHIKMQVEHVPQKAALPGSLGPLSALRRQVVCQR